jgi:hypothetical protein
VRSSILQNNGMESQGALNQMLRRIHYKDRHILREFDMGTPKTVLSNYILIPIKILKIPLHKVCHSRKCTATFPS